MFSSVMDLPPLLSVSSFSTHNIQLHRFSAKKFRGVIGWPMHVSTVCLSVDPSEVIVVTPILMAVGRGKVTQLTMAWWW